MLLLQTPRARRTSWTQVQRPARPVCPARQDLGCSKSNLRKTDHQLNQWRPTLRISSSRAPLCSTRSKTTQCTDLFQMPADLGHTSVSILDGIAVCHTL